MAEPSASSGIVQINPALSVRLREVADFLAAPATGRLTDEQRATVLGIARRLVGDVAAQLDAHIDSQDLWENWSHGGIPGAERLASMCFSRAEEFRWRQHSLHFANQLYGDMRPINESGETVDETTAEMPDANQGQESPLDIAHLELVIADRRRLDHYGQPRVPIADLDDLLYQSLLLDIAAAALVGSGNDPDMARQLGRDIRQLMTQKRSDNGIDAAAKRYFATVQGEKNGRHVIADAVRGHDWLSVIAAAAGHHDMRFEVMALCLLSANVDDVRAIFAPLGLDDAQIAPLVASLETVPNRYIAPIGSAKAGSGQDVYSTLLHSRAASLSAAEEEA